MQGNINTLTIILIETLTNYESHKLTERLPFKNTCNH